MQDELKEGAQESPAPIMEAIYGFWVSRLLKSGVDFNVFTHIHEGKATAVEIARAAGADARAMRYLLDALTGLKFLAKPTPAQYALPPVSEMFLVKSKPSYLGGLTGQVDKLWQAWGQLSEVVKTGSPFHQVDEKEKGPEFFKELVSQIFPLSYEVACMLADTMEIGTALRGVQVLDIAAGAGPCSIPFAMRDKTATVTAVDFPEVLEVTREFTARFGVGSQYRYKAGDIREIDFGVELYDIALLGHICHSAGEEETKILFEKTYKSLKPGGTILIPEMVPDNERTARTFPLMFAVNMLVNTRQGDAFTFEEYEKWLAACRFKDIHLIPTPGAASIVKATK